jgi:hypothetical protein
MKKNATVTRGVTGPIIAVHRDDLINPLCGLEPDYPKMAFGISLNGKQIDWKSSRYFSLPCSQLSFGYYCVKWPFCQR